MSENMLDRPARAIYEAVPCEGVLPWDELPDSDKAPWRAEALAVLATLREPTPAEVVFVAKAIGQAVNELGGSAPDFDALGDEDRAKVMEVSAAACRARIDVAMESREDT